MYGLEKERKKFDFDLEVEIKNDPNKREDLLKKIQWNIKDIKEKVKAKKIPKDMDDLTIFLDGYTALEKVIQNI